MSGLSVGVWSYPVAQAAINSCPPEISWPKRWTTAIDYMMVSSLAIASFRSIESTARRLDFRISV